MAANADAQSDGWLWTEDHVGGERVGQAIIGESSLGPLTPEERRYVADQAVATWSGTHDEEAVSELAEAVAENPQGRRDVAAALAEPAGTTARHHAEGGQLWTTKEQAAFERHMLDAALDLDASAVVDAFQGAEGVLAGHLTVEGTDPAARRAVLDAVAGGAVPEESADRMMVAMFTGAGGDDLRGGEDVRAWAAALARVTHPGDSPQAPYERQLLQDRLGSILESEGGRQVLFDDLDSGADVPPALRQAMLAEAIRDDAWTAETLAAGWESDAVISRFNDQLQERFANVPQQVAMRGADLEAYVGLATSAAPVEGGMPERPFAGNEAVERVRANVETLAGPDGTVSAIPVAVGSNEFGLAAQVVFRVDRPGQGPAFVDPTGHMSESLDEWVAESTLPEGRMLIREGLSLDGAWQAIQNTPEVDDTFGEKFWSAADTVATGVGLAALTVGAGAAIFFSGGTATPAVVAGATWVGAGAGLYQAGRAGEQLVDDGFDGLPVTDLGDPTMRGRWLTVAAGTLSFGALGALRHADEVRALTGATSRTLSTGVVALNGMAFAADAATTIDTANTLRENWNRMSPTERALGVAQVAFWAGMTRQGMHQNGGLRNSLDLPSAERLIRTGTPFEMQQVPGLAEGQMRVDYQDGLPVIQHGGTGWDPRALARHNEVAYTIERAQGLEGRLRELMGREGLTEFPPGTAGFEAELEIRKILSEAAAVRQDLNAGLAPADEAIALARLGELQQSLALEQARFDAPGAAGRGWVADPSRGIELVRGVDPALADAAPAGHHWHRAGPRQPGSELQPGQMAIRDQDGVEYIVELRRHDMGVEALALDAASGGFVPAAARATVPRGDFDNGAVERALSGGEVPLNGPDAIATIRAAAEAQGQPIHSAAGNAGVVSVLAIDGQVHVGVNSYNHPRADMTLQNHWGEKINSDGDPAIREMLFHAEAEGLMRAYAARDGQMPDRVTLQTDRFPCNRCQEHLMRLAGEMGIGTLRIELTNGQVYQSDAGGYVRRVN